MEDEEQGETIEVKQILKAILYFAVLALVIGYLGFTLGMNHICKVDGKVLGSGSVCLGEDEIGKITVDPEEYICIRRDSPMMGKLPMGMIE